MHLIPPLVSATEEQQDDNLATKDVCTHSGNHLRELYFPNSQRNISDRGQLAHNSKRSVFAAQAVHISTHQKRYTGNGLCYTVVHGGLCYKQVIGNCLYRKEGYLLDVAAMQSTQCSVQKTESMGKAPFGMSEGTYRPQTPRADSCQGDLHPFPKCHYVAALTLSFNTSPFHQTVLVFLLLLHVPSYNQHTGGDTFFPKDREPRDVTGKGICTCHS